MNPPIWTSRAIRASWRNDWARCDLSKLASAAQVPRQSAVRYFEILEDTLIVHRTEPFTKSVSRCLVQHPKFFFFDVGVRNGLLGSFDVSADRIGALFEQLIFSQLHAGAAARDREIRISSYRTEHGAEVDFIVEDRHDIWALELKASRQVGSGRSRGLQSFADFAGRKHRTMVLYLGDEARRVDGVDVMPWQAGLKAMGF